MRRFAAVSTVTVVAALGALFLTSLVWSAEEKPGSRPAARSVVRPQIKTVGPVGITGQLKKGLSKTDVAKLTPPPQESRETGIPKAKLPTVQKSTSILKTMRGGQALLKSAPVPESGGLPDNANLLLTPLKPRGSLSGVKSAFIWLSGVFMGKDSTSLAGSASQDRVCVQSEENGGVVGVYLSGIEPGWYVVAGDFVARTGGAHGLRSLWYLQEERNGGQFEISSTLKPGDELFLPTIFQATRTNSQVYVNFYPGGLPVWFRGVSVQKLN